MARRKLGTQRLEISATGLGCPGAALARIDELASNGAAAGERWPAASMATLEP
jgi:uridine phosphorylase